MREDLRNNEILRPSMGDDISYKLLEQLQNTKDRVLEQQEQGYKVALLHLSGDLMHSSHIQYMNTAKNKLEEKFGWKVKLLVWVEADSRTIQRKNKENINNEEERAYMFENLKSVDKAYIEFEGVIGDWNEERPAGIVKFLAPDIMVSHQEHINNFWEYLWVCRRLAKNNWWKVVVINYWDEEKYLKEKSKRDEYKSSTTDKIRKIFSLYKWNQKYDK